jgi:hypothetical protein
MEDGKAARRMENGKVKMENVGFERRLHDAARTSLLAVYRGCGNSVGSANHDI